MSPTGQRGGVFVGGLHFAESENVDFMRSHLRAT
jgi:hypothetical protein